MNDSGFELIDAPRTAAPAAATAAELGAFSRRLLADIPLARAMGLVAVAHDGRSLTLRAPLAPNVNDKGCAFGGSLASLMTLAGWGLLKIAVDARAVEADIYVQDSTIRYLAPVWEDLLAIAELAPGEDFTAFFSALSSRGKGRLSIVCRVPLPGGGAAVTLEARFVALVRR